MIAAILISLREGLEASLVTGIVFGYLKKTGQMRYRWYAWAGVAAAILFSLVFALGIQAIGAELEGRAEEIFEGAMMLLAVAVLTWMIFWMRYQARAIKGELESELELAVQASNPRALFAVTFLAVAREGVETALLLTAAIYASDAFNIIVGSLLGFALAVLIGVLLYASTVRLNMRLFFNVTGILLLLFAAGLLGRGVHEFQEAGVLLTIQEHVWDLNHLLPEDGLLGQILRTLFGYNANPSLLEVIAYVAYWIVALFGMPWLVNRRYQNRQIAHAETLGTA